jgi:serine/threonine protein kinase
VRSIDTSEKVNCLGTQLRGELSHSHVSFSMTSFRSCAKSFAYDNATSSLDSDFQIEGAAFGRYRDKYRAVLINDTIYQEQLALAGKGDSFRKTSSSKGSSSSSRSKTFVVCIKVVPKNKLQGAVLSDLIREVRAAMKLRHSNLNAVYGYNNFDSNNFYIVEDFYGVGDLASLKAQKEIKWSEGLIRAIVKPVLSALDFLHGTGVAYESLALSNIVLNNNGRVKLRLVCDCVARL